MNMCAVCEFWVLKPLGAWPCVVCMDMCSVHGCLL